MNWKNQLFASTLMLAFAAIPARAQSLEDLNIQMHGYATQGFLYTTQNNIFYANSSDGSPAWTEAVVNISAVPMPKLRVAVQARYQILGDVGNTITLDWAAADYKANERIGVRFGKVKTPWGLFNETQDLDPTYLWALLPQSVYDITTRNADLAHYGGVFYGTKGLGAQGGKLAYRIWGGEQVTASNDGSFADLDDAGHAPPNGMTNVTYGGALHWLTPISGLMIGASDGKMNQASVPLTGGKETFAPWNNVSYFASYEKNKVMVAGEWNRQANQSILALTGSPVTTLTSDGRGWYGMASYKVAAKFTAGIYDSQLVDHQMPLGADRYSKDWVISGRYDFNQFIYIKAEQHFIDGTALSFENRDNPEPKPSSKLTALKIGVNF